MWKNSIRKPLTSGLNTDLTLDSVGAHKMRSQGEEHRYNPRTIHLLQQSAKCGSYEMFKEYTNW